MHHCLYTGQLPQWAYNPSENGMDMDIIQSLGEIHQVHLKSPTSLPAVHAQLPTFESSDRLISRLATLTPLASLAPLATGRAVARAPALIASQVRHSGHAHTMQDRRHRAGGTFLGWPIDDLGWPIDDLYHSYFRGEWLHLCFTQLSLVEPLTSAAQGPRTGSPLTHRFLGYGYLNRQLHVIVY